MIKEEIALRLVESWGRQHGTVRAGEFWTNYEYFLEKLGYIDELKVNHDEVERLKGTINSIKEWLKSEIEMAKEEYVPAFETMLEIIEEKERGE